MGLLGPVDEALAQRRKKTVRTITVTAEDTGTYKYLPFGVPRGANRLDVELVVNGEAKVGVGLFDWRGTEHQSFGFRGVYGEEFFVGTKNSSLAFIPGNIRRGEWTVIVPVFRGSPSEITVTIAFSYGHESNAPSLGQEAGVVKSAPGWYRGDQHCHTVHSSDAWASGSALTPAGWAQTAKEIGLD